MVWTKGKENQIVNGFELEIDNEENEETRPTTPTNEEQVLNALARPKKLTQELKMLRIYNKPESLEKVHFCFLNNEINEIEEDKPRNFQEAWLHPNLKKQEKWRESIRLEFRQLLKNGVWQRGTTIGILPSDRRGFGIKWVFKIKMECTDQD